MHKFKIITARGHESEVEAEYHVVDEGFMVFKTADHKQVAAFPVHAIDSVVRLGGAPISVGQVTVKVKPEIDSDEWKRVIEQAAKQYGTSTA